MSLGTFFYTFPALYYSIDAGGQHDDGRVNNDDVVNDEAGGPEPNKKRAPISLRNVGKVGQISAIIRRRV